MYIMKTINASQARIPTQEFEAIVHHGERLRIQKGKQGQTSVYVINQEDMDLLHALEDEFWERKANRAYKEHLDSGEKTISWNDAKKDLGI